MLKPRRTENPKDGKTEGRKDGKTFFYGRNFEKLSLSFSRNMEQEASTITLHNLQSAVFKGSHLIASANAIVEKDGTRRKQLFYH